MIVDKTSMLPTTEKPLLRRDMLSPRVKSVGQQIRMNFPSWHNKSHFLPLFFFIVVSLHPPPPAFIGAEAITLKLSTSTESCGEISFVN